MNGVTGRMGTNQHLVRSILAIRKQGGVALSDGATLMPDPILVGRNESKLQQLAEAHGVARWSTDLAACLANPDDTIYFDAQTTQRRVADVSTAIRAGKHVYCEKPVSETVGEALELARLATEFGVKHGVVQDKLFLPGIMKLKRLIASGFFGRILSVRGEFGYWVFEGDLQPAQRPSWNYRREDGGGMTVDMLCHWRYVLDHVFGPVKRVSCLEVTHIPQRWDENGKPYQCTADDAAYACLEIEGGIVAQFNSSWAVRVNRDELFEMLHALHHDRRNGVHARGVAPPMGEDFERRSIVIVRALLGVDGRYDALAAEFLRRLAQEFWPPDRLGVDRDLVGAGQQQAADIF